MAVKTSTGLKNFLANGGSLKKALEDMVLDLCSGTPPASADDAATGQLLCRFTRNGATVVPGSKSTAQVDQVVVTAGSQGDTFTITIDGAEFTHAQLQADTADTIAAALAALVNASSSCPMAAVPVTGTTESAVLLIAKFAGEGSTTAVSKTGGGTITKTAITANSRIDSLHLGSPSNGSIAKANETWSGVGLAAGTATYYRFIATDDNNGQSSTAKRIQGVCGSVGADAVLSNTSIAVGATNTVSTCQFNIVNIG